MELSAIYHRPESEYAYLYKDKKLHIRIRTKKGDIESINLHYGDPFIFMEEFYQDTKEMVKITSGTLFDHWQVEVSVDFARIQYLFELRDTEGQNILYGDKGCVENSLENLHAIGNGFKLPYLHEIDACKVPDWVSNTVWYQIFPERFANGNALLNPEGTLDWDSSVTPKSDDFFGGDLQGIIDHIGDKETFRELVDQAHHRGMKVMLDAVFNHIGSQSLQWKNVVKNGEQSAYKDWFHIQQFPVTTEKLVNKRDLPYHVFGFEDYMPKLNTANPEVKNYLLKVATYWIEEFNIDAWRLDVANEIDHQFWKDFRKAVLAKNPDLYILGEVWHTSQPWLNGDEFHAVMNYPLSDSIKDYFLRGIKKTDQFIDEINGEFMYYKQQISEVMFNLLDSHDTERILWTANEDVQLVKSALAFLFLQKGTPCIYYGTELALTGGPDPDCRRCMPWERVSSDNDMLNFMKRLIKIRKYASVIISHGKYSLQEIKSDLVALEWKYEGRILKAIFNQSTEDYLLEKEAVALASNCQELENQLVISPDGFVIF
ncbi:glycoside hydrolase family 13 protein [Streptococcus pneumoniae]|nr:glycoside hydrolase family 13 protein [Streptococcus pneumoniae]